MEFAGFVPPDAFWAMNDELEERVRQGAGRLPLFRLVDWDGPLMLGSWQIDASEGGVVHGNAFPANPATNPLMEVVTSTRNPLEVVRNRWQAIAGPPKSLEELQSQSAGFAAHTTAHLSAIVDGIPADFTLWNGTDYWFAAGSAGGYGIVIDARSHRSDTQAMELRQIPDVEPLLQARRAALKAARGEA
ncbi:hypothetical protein [Paenarthrobacter aromaticivorans]|uniref:hypothetical protein n=1 Tax=Paenarthrobacter aromaticivorans TaxID=2849150 RepID=UPI003A7F662C